MKQLVFLEKPLCYSDETELIAYLPKIKGKDDLLKALSKIFNFPDYFGFNWDALSDCLRDFNWVEKKGIVLVHNEMPELEDKNFKIFLEIIGDTTEDWKDGEDVVVVPAIKTADIPAKFPKGFTEIKPYLRMTPQPNK